MRIFAQRFALFSLCSSLWGLLRPKPAVGPVLAILLSPIKLLAGALACLSAVLGALGAVFGLLSRNPLALFAGGMGALLSARYIRRVTADHDGFERAFGVHWQERISPEMASRMLQRRGPCLLPLAPPPRWTRDLVFWSLPATTLSERQPGAEPGAGNSPQRLLCDLWQPPPGLQASGLALIFFHGGGWHQFDKDSLTRPFFRHLAAQGHVIMDVAYRLRPDADLVGMVGDAKRAVAWMVANAARFGVDPDRVVVAGGSAGGHLALMAGYTPGHSALTPDDLQHCDIKVRAVVAWYPIVDLSAYAGYNDYRTVRFGPFELTSPREAVPALLGAMPDEAPERYDLLSPLNHAGPHCPPTLLLQAGHDHVVPGEGVRALQARLQTAGVPVVCVEYPGTEHAFDLVLPWVSPAAQAAWYDVERFLALVV